MLYIFMSSKYTIQQFDQNLNNQIPNLLLFAKFFLRAWLGRYQPDAIRQFMFLSNAFLNLRVYSLHQDYSVNHRIRAHFGFL